VDLDLWLRLALRVMLLWLPSPPAASPAASEKEKRDMTTSITKSGRNILVGTSMIFAIGVMAAFPGTAAASLVVSGSPGAGWQAFPGGLNSYATATRPFWDQPSKDGGTRNIGNYLNGTYSGSQPSASASSPGITPSWWGHTSTTDYAATMDTSLGFTLTGGSVSSTLLLEVAGRANQNEIGWFNRADAVGSETLNVIFAGPATAVSSTVFAPSASFGLYLKSGGNVFFSESLRNRGGTALDRATQHFAVFASSLVSGSETYHIGTEDLLRSETGIENVGDYNDVVFSLAAIPTPGTSALALVGLALTASRRRR